MVDQLVQIKSDAKGFDLYESQKKTESQKKAETHLDNASKQHIEASNHHANGNYEKAAKRTVLAQGHLILADEAQKDDERIRVTNHAFEKQHVQ